jgi:protein-tyrosine-phosphatase
MREEFGIDISDHVPRSIEDAGPDFQLVLAVDGSVLREIRRRWPEAPAFLLTGYSPGGGVINIDDPYDSPLEDYRQLARQLAPLMKCIADRIAETG